MKYLILALCVLILAPLTGCNSYEPKRQVVRTGHYETNHYGTVRDIEVVTLAPNSSGGGAILGAVLGGVLGHQMGRGRGRDLTTGAGALGGAVLGNQLEGRSRADREVYRVTIQFENGSRQQIDCDEIGGLRVGDRVRVENGQIERL